LKLGCTLGKALSGIRPGTTVLSVRPVSELRFVTMFAFGGTASAPPATLSSPGVSLERSFGINLRATVFKFGIMLAALEPDIMLPLPEAGDPDAPEPDIMLLVLEAEAPEPAIMLPPPNGCNADAPEPNIVLPEPEGCDADALDPAAPPDGVC
jgi:hypothetical protein